MKAQKSTILKTQRLLEPFCYHSSQIQTEMLHEHTSNCNEEMRLRTRNEEELRGSWLDIPIMMGIIGGVLLTSSIALGTAAQTFKETANPYLERITAPIGH